MAEQKVDDDYNDGFPHDFDQSKLQGSNGPTKQDGKKDEYTIEGLRDVTRKSGITKPIFGCTGQILIDYGEGKDDMRSGTGTVIRKLSNHHYIVLTCAHNAVTYHKVTQQKTEAQKMWFMPKGCGEFKCRLQYVAKMIYDTYNPENDLCENDLAMILFYDKKWHNGPGSQHYDSVNVNELIKLIDWDDNEDPIMHLFGYPSKSQGRLQGRVGEAELDRDRGLWLYQDIFTYPGQSGSALFKKIRKEKKFAPYGIHTFGDVEKQHNCGVFIDAKKMEWIKNTVNRFEGIANAHAPKETNIVNDDITQDNRDKTTKLMDELLKLKQSLEKSEAIIDAKDHQLSQTKKIMDVNKKLREDMNKMTDQYHDLQMQNNNLEEHKEKQSAVLNSRIVQYQSRSQQFQKEIHLLENKKQQLKLENKSLQDLNDQYKIQIDYITKDRLYKTTQLNAQLEKFKVLHQDEQQENEEIMDEVLKLKRALDKSETIIDAQDHQLSEKRKYLNNLNKELAEKERRVSNIFKEKLSLETQLNELKTTVSNYKSDLSEKEDEIEQLKQTLEERTEELVAKNHKLTQRFATLNHMLYGIDKNIAKEKHSSPIYYTDSKEQMKTLQRDYDENKKRLNALKLMELPSDREKRLRVLLKICTLEEDLRHLNVKMKNIDTKIAKGNKAEHSLMAQYEYLQKQEAKKNNPKQHKKALQRDHVMNYIDAALTMNVMRRDSDDDIDDYRFIV